MSLIDVGGPADEAQVALVRSAIGALAAAKYGLLVAELSLIPRLGAPDATVLTVCLLVVVGAAASAGVALSRRPNLAAGLAASAGVALMLAVPGVASHHFHLLVLLLGVCAVVDARPRRVRPSTDPRSRVDGWPLVLLRCQLSIVYVATALSKVNGDYLSGAMAHGLVRSSVVSVPLPEDLLRSSTFLGSASLVLLVVELGLGVAVWSARLRPVVFAVALPLHASMTMLASPDLITLVEVTIFSTAMFVLLFTFVEVPGRSWTLVPAHGSGGAGPPAWAARLDLLDVVDVVDGAGVGAPGASSSWSLRSADAGRELTGRVAVQHLLAWSPVGFLLAPWLSVPGVRQVAERRWGASDDRAPRRGASLVPAVDRR